MTITRIKLERFTAFESLDVKLSGGMNVFIGANGTGKTHLLKALYAACDITKSGESFTKKLLDLFLPHDRNLGRLVHRRRGRAIGSLEIYNTDMRVRITLSSARSKTRVMGKDNWLQRKVESVYIPPKEMLANAPGFRSLYATREIHFDSTYVDILDRAFRPPLRGPIDRQRKRLLTMLQKAIDGKVSIKEEEFFLRNKQGNLEFSLLAEGTRKLGLLWLLIQNGTLLQGSVLFWDEPETNLNPKLYGILMDILLELQRNGVQIFLATHDYVILKELDLRKKNSDKIAFHSLFRDRDGGQIICNTINSYLDIHPNTIAEAFADLYDREVKRSLGGIKE